MQISSQAQTFIHNAMLYHMDSDTRDQILKLPRPEVSEALPEFDALDARLKTWLHDVYGPAFVSNAIARADPDRKEVWQQKMSDEERLRIRYWFSGRVSQHRADRPAYTIDIQSPREKHVFHMTVITRR